ncbi:hypothetical protein PIB30_052670 [Stylosanthes scabra]|uniref:Uncharacterized protein n=1 Tax=Stylosanthes scabra TaxID=79078 RepID=A0ABU6QHQ9_9FABA|nr:hypothetical protein [Stylosanthes scabra]
MKEEVWIDVVKKGNKAGSSNSLGGNKGVATNKALVRRTNVGGNKATRKLPISANKKTSSIKPSQGGSLLTPVTFNADKRRRPPSLQNSPIDLALERIMPYPYRLRFHIQRLPILRQLYQLWFRHVCLRMIPELEMLYKFHRLWNPRVLWLPRRE